MIKEKSRTPPEGAYVVKRDGRKEEVNPEKITSRVTKLCYGLDMNYINPVEFKRILWINIFKLQNHITAKAASGIYKGVTTVELDNLAAEVAASMTTMHPDYALLAARIAISNLHKETKKVLKISRQKSNIWSVISGFLWYHNRFVQLHWSRGWQPLSNGQRGNLQHCTGKQRGNGQYKKNNFLIN